MRVDVCDRHAIVSFEGDDENMEFEKETFLLILQSIQDNVKKQMKEEEKE